jgi:hypothetical protein
MRSASAASSARTSSSSSIGGRSASSRCCAMPPVARSEPLRQASACSALNLPLDIEFCVFVFSLPLFHPFGEYPAKGSRIERIKSPAPNHFSSALNAPCLQLLFHPPETGAPNTAVTELDRDRSPHVFWQIGLTTIVRWNHLFRPTTPTLDRLVHATPPGRSAVTLLSIGPRCSAVVRTASRMKLCARCP